MILLKILAVFIAIVIPFSLASGEDVVSFIKKGDEFYAERADIRKCKESIEYYKKALEVDP